MAVKRTTMELDEDLMRAAQSVTGGTMRSTVEAGLRRLLADAEEESAEQRRRVAEHLASAQAQIDADVLLRDQAWR